jgi:hypothetical protein
VISPVAIQGVDMKAWNKWSNFQRGKDTPSPSTNGLSKKYGYGVVNYGLQPLGPTYILALM